MRSLDLGGALALLHVKPSYLFNCILTIRKELEVCEPIVEFLPLSKEALSNKPGLSVVMVKCTKQEGISDFKEGLKLAFEKIRKECEVDEKSVIRIFMVDGEVASMEV